MAVDETETPCSVGEVHVPISALAEGGRVVVSPAEDRTATVHELLRCMWSGYPDRGDRCHAHVPADIAAKAWEQEVALAHRTEGFFHFIWHNGQWLGYGTSDGSVRGVYCATHCAERAARIMREQSEPLGEAVQTAL